ncbi:MAG TPA: thiolase family protein [Burkholderiales bacterium]|nr:thiolase family protein [Burkholderiales bacterium]
MNWLRQRDIAIIGYAETKLTRRSGRSVLELAGEVLRSLTERTGIEAERIDGLATTQAWSEAGNPFYTSSLAEGLGLSLTWSQVTDIGGASPVGNVARAAAAIRAGMCEMVLCLNADAVSTQDFGRQTWYRTEFLEPAGFSGPLVEFAMLTNAYAHRYGSPDAALAKLAVTQRQGALNNELACEVLRRPLSEQDYLDSKFVSRPLRLLDCVMRCDGANGVLVTSTRLARELGAKKMVHPIAYRERVNFDARQTVEDITLSGFSEVGPKVLADAGMRARDVRMFHPYDDFLIVMPMKLEHIGFCGPGEGAHFILEHDIGPTGDLPINTGGGQISAGQPGLAGGGVNLVEAVRQLFGEAGSRQVPDARNALVTGMGGVQYVRNWANSCAMILEPGA